MKKKKVIFFLPKGGNRSFAFSKVASFGIDLEKGFSELCPEQLPVPGALEVVPEIQKQEKAAEIIMRSKDAHSPDAQWCATKEAPQFTPIIGFKDLDLRWNMHCVPGTLGFEFLPGLNEDDKIDFMVYKGIETNMHPYGACYRDLADTKSTGAIEFLEAKKIEAVVVGGIATSYCLKKTVLQLCACQKFTVFVNLAACRDIPGSDTEGSIREMELAGAITLNSADDIVLIEK